MKTDLLKKLQETGEKLQSDQRRVHKHREHFAMQVQARPQITKTILRDTRRTPATIFNQTPTLLILLIMVAVISVGIRHPDTVQTMYTVARAATQQAVVWLSPDDTSNFYQAPAKPNQVQILQDSVDQPRQPATNTKPISMMTSKEPSTTNTLQHDRPQHAAAQAQTGSTTHQVAAKGLSQQAPIPEAVSLVELHKYSSQKETVLTKTPIKQKEASATSSNRRAILPEQKLSGYDYSEACRDYRHQCR